MFDPQGRFLDRKWNFVTVTTVTIGPLLALLLWWKFGDYGSAGFWLFMLLLWMLGAFIWALMMWAILGKYLLPLLDERLRRLDQTEENANKQSSKTGTLSQLIRLPSWFVFDLLDAKLRKPKFSCFDHTPCGKPGVWGLVDLATGRDTL